MSTRADQIFTLLLAMIFAGVAINALSFPPRARFMPLAIALPGLALCLWEIVVLRVKLRKEASGKSQEKVSKGSYFSKKFLLNVFALPGILFCMIYFLGFIITIPAFILGYMKIHSKESWMLSLGVAVIMLAAVYVGFSVFFKVPLSEGELVTFFERF